MNGFSSLSSVGVGQAAIQVRHQAASMKMHQAVVKGIGSAAVQLIQAAVSDPDIGNNFDVSI